MTSFKTRIGRISRANGPVILANDYPPSAGNLEKRTLENIRRLHGHICGIKLNLHLLLPLGQREIRRITAASARHGLVAIADIKLNDIGSTNTAAARTLWDLGFDAVIANPIMGLGSLRPLVASAHRHGRGVITLCHMSAPEASSTYDLRVGSSGPRPARTQRLHELFLRWAVREGADGIIAGATFPGIVERCSRAARGRLDIYSPGVGTQGGDALTAVSAGADYIIVGRTILNARDPVAAARGIQESVLDR